MALALAIAAGVTFWWTRAPAQPTCEQLVKDGKSRLAIKPCLEAYRRKGNNRDLQGLAMSYVRLGDDEQARALALKALKAPDHGDAYIVLSYVALRGGDYEAMEIYKQSALQAHKIAGNRSGLVQAKISSSQAAWQEGSYAFALSEADEALRMAKELDDPRRQRAAYFARSAALARQGDFREAGNALLEVLASATEPCDKALAYLKAGALRLEMKAEGMAADELRKAEQHNQECDSQDIAMQIAMNQVPLLWKGHPDQAIARLGKVENAKGVGVETQLFRGYLAADSGSLEAADFHLHLAAGLPNPDADWLWEILLARGQLAELRDPVNRAQLAEQHYRASIAEVTKLRSNSQRRAAYLLESHRAPYEGLMSLLARQGRWREVLEVVLELDASDMLRDPSEGTLAKRALQTDIDDASVTAVLEAWRGRELVIVFTQAKREIGDGRERAYRLRIRGGEVSGEDVGDAEQLREWAAQLAASLAEREAARGLGQLFVPADAPPGVPLEILAIGPLGKVRLPALRGADDALLLGRRALVRVLALRAFTPETAAGGESVVLADPSGDLQHSRSEGAMVAKALAAELPAHAVRSFARGEATRERLWEARGAGLLHYAGHVVAEGSRRALRLAGDQEVTPEDIVQHNLAPRLAVLASCISSNSEDQSGFGSIAAAFLEAGTAAVVATDRTVPDDLASEVMEGFYQQPSWRTAPAVALAQVQLELAHRAERAGDTSAKAQAWASFSVLVRPPVVTVPPMVAVPPVAPPAAPMPSKLATKTAAAP